MRTPSHETRTTAFLILHFNTKTGGRSLIVSRQKRGIGRYVPGLAGSRKFLQSRRSAWHWTHGEAVPRSLEELSPFRNKKGGVVERGGGINQGLVHYLWTKVRTYCIRVF
jgi:hypothetical protein